MPRQVSREIVEAIKCFEGFRPQKYLDVSGNATIGYGHLLTKKDKNLTEISPEDAEILLSADIEGVCGALEMYGISEKFSDNQWDAIVSLAFNIGAKRLAESSIAALYKSGNIEAISGQIERWVYAGGKRLLGLERRRKIERLWYDGRVEAAKELIGKWFS